MRLLTFMLLAGGFASAAQAYDVVVSAGPFARRGVVVAFDLPESGVESWRLRDGAVDVPLQVIASRAYFVLSDLPASTSRTYTLEPGVGPAGTPITAVPEGDNVRFTRATREITRYAGGAGALPSGVSESYRRAGYLHPVYTPRGRIVTDDYPADHRHHHGIWFAWTRTVYDGRSIDFWNMGQNLGGVQYDTLDYVFSGPAIAGLRATHRYVDKTATPDGIALWERYLLKVYPGGGTGTGTYSLFDAETTHDLVGFDYVNMSPMTLPEYHYGGVAYRAAAEWNANPSQFSVLTSEGRTRADGDGTRARWLRFSGTIGGGPASLVIYCHPGNFRAPQPLRVNPDDPVFGFPPSKLGAWSIHPDQPYVMKYRFAVYDETPAVSEVERLWNDYATPPTVTVR